MTNYRPDEFLERYRRLAGPVLFLVALALYSLTLCITPYPGESARLICVHSGVDPFPPMSHLLWYHLARLVGLLAGGSLVFILNLLSAFFGAGAVWLLYELASRAPHDRTSEEVEARIPTGPSKTLTGIVSALFLLTCAPFWFVSTRAHTASFDVFLVLLAIYLLVRFYETRRAGLAYAFALLLALGITEFSTLIVLTPVLGLALLYCLFRANMLKFKPLLILGLCVVAGLSLYLIYAWEYTRLPAYTWRKFTSYFLVLFYLWRDQYRDIRFSLPQIGWLLVFLVTVLPWLIVAVPKRSLTRSAVVGSMFLHGLLSLLGLLVMFNVPIAPWPLLKLRPLLVTPYVLLATCMGYLAGYWYMIILQYSRFESRSSQTAKGAARGAYFPVLAIIFLSAVALNFRFVDRRATAAVDRFVDEVVERAAGRGWLISNGYLDDLIALRARQKGQQLILINTAQGKSESYLKYLSTLFDDSRLKGLVQVGLDPFLDEWLGGTPGLEKDVSVLVSPDLWSSCGYTPVPDRVLFVGVTNSAVDANRLYAEQKEFWGQFEPILRKESKRPSLVSDWNRWVGSQVSKVANNTGVLLEDLGKKKEAFEAYGAARTLDTNNVSALLNQLTLAHAESLPEEPKLQGELADYERRLRGRLDIWLLSYHYGYVRNPEAFANRGWLWAMSGKPKIAINEMRKAVAMGADKQKAELAMASFYSMQHMTDESEQMYLSILKDNTTNQTALLGLTRLSLRKMDFDAARTYLARLRQSGADDVSVGVEEAIVESVAGNISAAKAKLLKLAEDNPDRMNIWNTLAIIALTDRDEKLLEKCVSVLTPVAAKSQDTLNTLATLALGRGDLKTARRYLDNIIRVNPQNVQTLERLLQLDLHESNRLLAEGHVEQILAIDPRSAFGNLILGSIQYGRAEYELAEASYRTSLSSRRSSRALNDLAWILQMKGQYEEALTLVKESISINRNDPAAWDTQGVVLMEMNKMDEAQQAFQQALSIQPGNPVFILHIAQLYERNGMKDQALKLADPLLARPSEMSPDDYEKLRALCRKLRGAQS
jgi:tetratricopeptide (TPR) repeat protein